jgi:hypothetical protein
MDAGGCNMKRWTREVSDGLGGKWQKKKKISGHGSGVKKMQNAVESR